MKVSGFEKKDLSKMLPVVSQQLIIAVRVATGRVLPISAVG
jgi:hypothetical protein